MGASHPGDIRALVEYVEPTFGMITNVGRAHLQGFGSFEGVMATKGELYDYLAAHHCQTFIDAANPYLTAMAAERHLDDTMTYSADAARAESGCCSGYSARGHGISARGSRRSGVRW